MRHELTTFPWCFCVLRPTRTSYLVPLSPLQLFPAPLDNHCIHLPPTVFSLKHPLSSPVINRLSVCARDISDHVRTLFHSISPVFSHWTIILHYNFSLFCGQVLVLVNGYVCFPWVVNYVSWSLIHLMGVLSPMIANDCSRLLWCRGLWTQLLTCSYNKKCISLLTCSGTWHK